MSFRIFAKGVLFHVDAVFVAPTAGSALGFA